MSLDHRIRKAKSPQDTPDLIHLKSVVSAELLTVLGHTSDEVRNWQERFISPDYVRQWTRAPYATFVLEEFDHEEQPAIVAMAGLSMRNDGDDSYAYFGNSYCSEINKGYGSRLMEYRLGVVENFNIDYISCHVQERNEKARKFVEHYGFEQSGVMRDKRLNSSLLVYQKVVE